ncbi:MULTISPECIES: NAD(P)/FAD-dependent oxidoreductase [Pseudoxanthomonas]|uniref:Cation diffusion facilitator CzcD-associated flavoprotein CzcO n=1 Tax=Pseudoxanthomonas winnipegensis TaxID=2480810 RepID=A0AAW8GDP3_9GAMM|nr:MULTISPECIES: NAD(P)/FAD-dependent oxidoreductase [Pseudoxanthomonas]MDQ1119238.1 cation diffusion facilitator CzcD-associated flavoprotein CzcO [Pseudoxanthomonas winnipegensis]MDR6137560.1 cation diffusion facilitator CzcD-associated flavoprotein CzcO [Pseudoxanthomonas sp. SORGH_AS_0997]
MSLADLETRVAHDLACLDHGKPDWTRPRTHDQGHVFDVVIVGGGQSGLGAAFALLRERVSNLLVIDECPEGREGPWLSYARMVTLRTPKQITSIDLGLPSLTFRAWWEAQHGAAGWEALDKIPREDWMAYLRWYRGVLRLPVRNDTRLVRLEPLPEQGLHRLHLHDGGTLLARKVILATGIQGGGQWVVPKFVSDHLPPTRYAHTSGPLDYAALAGKRIAILGGGASAFDNAQYALQRGVREAHVFVRRAQLPRVNPIRHMEQAGIIARFPALPDADKYALMASFFARNQPPTNDTFARAVAMPGFHLHLGAPWLSVAERDGQAVVTTPQGAQAFDFLAIATGLVTDPDLRPELAALAPAIARWRDRYVPPAGAANPLLDAHPYLGPGFELQPRTAEDAARLHGLFAFNYSALINLGLSAAALSGLKYALPRLAQAVANQLFVDDRAAVVRDFLAFDEEEFTGQWPLSQESAA